MRDLLNQHPHRNPQDHDVSHGTISGSRWERKGKMGERLKGEAKDKKDKEGLGVKNGDLGRKLREEKGG